MKVVLACFHAALLSITILSTGFSEIDFTAILTGEDEVPASGVAGKGAGVFTLDDSRTQLSFAIGVSGLSGPIIAAHFHHAPRGENGDVVRILTPDFTNNVAVGTWTSTDPTSPLTPSVVSDLLRGNIYVNVHTGAHGGGELRGQLRIGGTIDFTASLDGSQETPPVTTSATGKGTFSLNAAGTELTFDISLSGLTGPMSAAHFHRAPRGVPGPVVRNLTADFSITTNRAIGTWKGTDPSPLTRGLVGSLCAANIYVNAHTGVNQGGEVRGQLEIQTQAPAGEVHDLAVTGIKAPKTIVLSAKHPSVTKPVIVQIQNRSPQNELIPSLNTLEHLVTLTVSSINASDGVLAPTPTFRGTKKRFPITLKPKQKLVLIYDVVFDHANDGLKTSKKSPGHDDFNYTASVDHSQLDGADDTDANDDTCPRSVNPPFEVDSSGIKDKGCGAKKTDRTFGAEIDTDVVKK